MRIAPASQPQIVQLPTRRGRTAAVLAVSVAATALLAWAMTQPEAGIGPEEFYIAIFPLLAIVCAYRLVRPKVPFEADPEGVTVATGLPLLGLKARFAWTEVARVRITARDLLLIELRDPEAWSAGKPWLVRANIRATRRKFDAAAVLALKELSATPSELAASLRALAPVKVESV